MLKGLRAVIFDNDGTVANTRKSIVAGMEHVIGTYLKVDPKEIDYLKWIGLPLEDQMPKFTTDISLQKVMVQAYRDFDAINHSKLLEKFDGCEQCLCKLNSGGLKLGIATSKLATRCEAGLEQLGIRQYMTEIVGVEHTKLHKPNPEPILHCANLLGEKIENCAYVGDAPFDIQAANAARCISIGVTWGFFTKEDLKAYKPDYIVNSFEELSDLLL